MKPAQLFFLIFLFGGLPARLLAQTNEGRNFWFSFMEHHDIGQNTMVVMITSKYNTSGTVRIPLYNWERTYSVAANKVTIVNLPPFAENTGSETLSDKGVQVVSEEPVSVYIHQYHSMRSEATVVLPEESLGRDYYVMSYFSYQESELYPSEFVLVGMEDDTQISITLSDKTKGGKTKGSTFSISLDAGETYQVQAGASGADLTGTYVKGDKKFNLFSGCRWVQLPVGCNYRDNLFEQMVPVAVWGKKFVSVPYAHMPYDIFRILASEDGTQVTVQGSTTLQYQLDAGEYIEYKQSFPTYISASRPVTVAQYLIGSACSGYPVGDPAMLILNSVEQIRDTVTLYNSSFENITENYINVMAKTADLDVTYFDGTPLKNLGVPIQSVGSNADFSFATLLVSPGAHTILSGGCGVIANAYGYGNVESYSYGGGASFKPINASSLIPEGGCLNDTIFFKTDFKAPRHSVLWDFGDGTTSTEPNFLHQYTALGTYPVTLYLTDNCLNQKDTITRNVLITLRQAVAVTGDQAACQGQTITLGAVDLPGARYEWTGPNGFLSTQQNPVLPDLQAAQAGTYLVTGIISGCATFPAPAEVVVYPLPEPDLGPDTLVCADDGYPLAVLHPGSFQVYRWQDNSATPSYEVQREGAYWVRVIDDKGCAQTDSMSLRELCPTRYYIPNVFSPNDDGENDYFSVFGSDILALQLSVYDRWGNLLFQSTDIDARWDGYARGTVLDPGVFVWVARIEGYRKDGTFFTTTESGSVTLVY
ncbi:MAG: gliding motility-associated C-terminal domain-containing protein [Saprospiraceae bacterium]|nr:gliding motility-associated C-terminal domain-containing protein [Saprospiraceae bacterium]